MGGGEAFVAVRLYPKKDPQKTFLVFILIIQLN
jgi:hypothetical protein